MFVFIPNLGLFPSNWIEAGRLHTPTDPSPCGPQEGRLAEISKVSHVCLNLQPCLVTEQAPTSRGDINRVRGLLPEARRYALKRAAAPLLVGIDTHDRPEIIRAVKSLPEGQRDAIIAAALPFLRGKNCLQKVSTLHAIAALPKDERERDEILTAARPYMGTVDEFGRESNDGIAEAIRFLASIPTKEQRNALIAVARPFLEGIKNETLPLRILKHVASIPEEERDDVIAATTRLLEEEVQFEKTALLLSIAKIDREQRAAFLREVTPLLSGISNKNIYIDAVAALPAEQRSAILAATAPLLRGIRLDGYPRSDLICAVGSLLPEQRRAVIEAATPLLEGITEGKEKAAIISAVGCLLPDQRRAVIEAATPLLRNIVDGYQRSNIIRAVGSLSERQRNDLSRTVIPFLRDLASGYERVAILKAVTSLTREQTDALLAAATHLTRIRGGYCGATAILACASLSEEELDTIPTVIEKTKLLFKNDRFISLPKKIYEAVKSLPKMQRAALIAVAPSFLECKTSPDQITEIFRFLGSLGERRDAIIAAAAPLLRNLVNRSTTGIPILHAVADLPETEMDAILRMATPFLDNIEWGPNKADTIRAIASIPDEEQRRVILAAAAPFLDNSSTGSTANIIRAIASIPDEEQRRVILAAAAPLLRDCPGESKAAIIRAVSNLPETQRDAILAAVPRLVGTTNNLNGSKATIIRIIADFPEGQRDTIIDTIVLYMRGLPYYETIRVLKLFSKMYAAKELEEEELTELTNAIPFLMIRNSERFDILTALPPGDVLATEKLLCDDPDLTLDEILEEVCGLKERIIAFHRDVLEHSPTKQLALDSAQAILVNFKALGLSEDDELVILAQVCKNDILSEQTDKKDPYKVHAKLLKNSKKKYLSFQEIGGDRISTAALARHAPISITVRELRTSQGSLPTHEDMRNLFTQLLRKSSAAESSGILTDTLDSCRTACVESVFIQNLFAKIGGPDSEKLPPDAIQLAVVMNHILSLKDQASNANPLSLRETTFLGFLESIRHYETGKKEGFEKFYEGILREGGAVAGQNTVAGGGAASAP